MAGKGAPDTSAFRVSLARHLLTGLVLGMPGLQRRLAALESAWLRERIDQVPLDRPVWICGMARSGTTILLEALATAPDVATHQYRDVPFVHTPWWWRRFLERAGGGAGAQEARERAHGDGIVVTPRSPEAMEEPLWMSHFEGLHDPGRSNVLGRADAQHDRRFGGFYRDHIRKLLLAGDARRYLAKANYNLTRLGFLHALFPDARFVVPVRAPEAHIASLVRQHRLFLAAARDHPRSVAHLDRVGHFEFGAHRTPVHAGDDQEVAGILQAWEEGREVLGWARAWAHLHGWLRRTLDEDPALRQATLVVRYEALCRDTDAVLRRILTHTELAEGPDADTLVDAFADTLEAPDYYDPGLSSEERRTIRRETAEVARTFGYDP